MKFKLLINPYKDEVVQAQVHEETNFTDNLKQYVLTNGDSNQITAYDDKDIIILSLDKITLITVIDNKIWAICTDNKRFRLKKRIYQLNDELPNNFWRINKSSITNRYQINRFK